SAAKASPPPGNAPRTEAKGGSPDAPRSARAEDLAARARAPENAPADPAPGSAGSVPRAEPRTVEAAPPEAPAPGSAADTLERLLSGEEVDSGLAAMERRRSERAPPLDANWASDLSEVRELFAHIAANHVRQVRDFMIDVRWGQATVDWIDICDPSIQ